MIENDNDAILFDVAEYYSDKLEKYGSTPQGVDWNGNGSQLLRFEQLAKIININSLSFSINDLGCGYGAFYDFLICRYTEFMYYGFDICEEMIQAAKQRCISQKNAEFTQASKSDFIADYSVASGIFNVCLKQPENTWKKYIELTLDSLYETSQLGFSFNCLTSFSDSEKKRNYLYYADPGEWFSLCKHRYSRNVALLHDYNLYEFTILVRKD